MRDFVVARALLNAPGMTASWIEEEEDPRALAVREGVGGLDDRALLAVLIGRGGRGEAPGELADRLYRRLGGLSGLSRFGPESLAELPGIGASRALRLAASVELGRRMVLRLSEPREPLCAPEAVAAYLTPRIGVLDHEEMWVLSLDGRNGLRNARRVAQGGLHALAVSPGDILRAALWDGASGFVLAHNHPSGSPDPSAQDIETTRSVARAASAVGVPMLDHVIVTGSGDYRSLAELGLMEEVA